MIAVAASSISAERQTYNFLRRSGDGPIVRADGEQVLDSGVRCDSGMAPPACAVVQRDHLAGSRTGDLVSAAAIGRVGERSR